MERSIDDFCVGDTVKVLFKSLDKERVHSFEGLVIRKRGEGPNSTFTVRKVSYKVGIERTFPLLSPLIVSVQVLSHGKVRRAKLYYMRTRRGKEAKVKKRFVRKDVGRS
jgi:large subunit ribosomal protein L19